ncbi:hypothetical protein [Candidatus Carsonella ruddii]|uniref:Uncharacterized protein n=1 Tax=Carsonella ruddii TaxID=114186 RepID=A0A1U9RRE4_CARRU|nr:hypothetical protein [Candidatus Carsonella ruddii]AQU89472.1 hypothetical protein BW244_0054 [Candidatus Carsonella ruddii]
MNIIKYFLYFKNLNNSSKIINFDNFKIKFLKKTFLNKYNKKNFLINFYKIKIYKKNNKKYKKNEFFV